MSIKRVLATATLAFCGLAVLAPSIAEAAPRHARHKVCHWVR